jgi:hypothetical protein
MTMPKRIAVFMFIISLTVGLSSCESQRQSSRDSATVILAGHADDTTKQSAPPKSPEPDPNKGGAGVGPPTVHGCDSKGCGNNGPSTPTQPPKKCRRVNGIELCS